MKIYQYQQIMALNTGSTTYETDVCKILNININKQIKDVKLDIENQMKTLNSNIQKKNKLNVNGVWYMADDDILECSYEQFVELDRILAEDDNINNLHKLLAIYFRPRKFDLLKMKWRPKPFDMKNHEKISNYLQKNMDMAEANGYVVFFYQIASKSLRYMNISYLNLEKKRSMYMESRLKE